MDKTKREEIVKWFDGDEVATTTFLNKYSYKGEETPEDVNRRMAEQFYKIEQKYDKGGDKLASDYGQKRENLTLKRIENYFNDYVIIPQGSVQASLGTDQVTSLSNCFVAPSPSDSYGGIFHTDQILAQLMKRRGGVGTDISGLRPEGAGVNNAAKSSSGAVSFMNRFSNTTREVSQQGRRGALILTMNINHPDILEFIKIKRDLTKVTGANISVKLNEEFMEAVKYDRDYLLRFPVEEPEQSFYISEIVEHNKLYKGLKEGTYFKLIKAKQYWDELIKSAHSVAEPGIMYWGKMIDYAPDSVYKNHKPISSNPCITGDTLISVADGRGQIPIKQLVEEGNDVDVYCSDNDGNLTIRKMRNPRITGHNEDIYEVEISNGHKIKVTVNHKFRLTDGRYVEATELKEGDSLHIMSKVFINNKNNRHIKLHSNNDSVNEHRFLLEQQGKDLTDKVVHHKNYNPYDNLIDNLQVLTPSEHNSEHKEQTAGLNNGRAYNITNKELYDIVLKESRRIGRRMSIKEYDKLAIEKKLPLSFSKFRGDKLSLLKQVAIDLGFKHIDLDPRIVKTYQRAINNGYDTHIINDKVYVTKKCEGCGTEFLKEWGEREVSYCSTQCSLKYLSGKDDWKNKQKEGVNKTAKQKGDIKKSSQIKAYLELSDKLKRIPLMKEWENYCSEKGIVKRLDTKYGFKNYSDLKEASEFFNHKVISVKKIGKDTVYNGTVDEFHNFFAGGFIEKTKNGYRKELSINQMQCGEIALPAHDSCRLIAINYSKFVTEPFTKNAKFNKELFYQTVYEAQRLMDDLVDLEIINLDRIINKIENDSQPDEIKRVELTLWKNVRDKALRGRRTGLGLTGVADMFAMLNLKYDSDEAIDLLESIMKVKMRAELDSTIDMSIERGSFPDYSFDIEYEYEKDIDDDRDFYYGNNDFYEFIYKEFRTQWHRMKRYGRRNISWSTVSPTGTISMMAGVTSGLEPMFMPYYVRRIKVVGDERVDFVDDNGDKWKESPVIHRMFEKWFVVASGSEHYPEGALKQLRNANSKELDKVFKESPWYKSTASDIDPFKRNTIQGIIQKYTSHSISSTINLPSDVSEQVVSDIYLDGYSKGLKGQTVYRDGSRSGVLLTGNDIDNSLFDYESSPKRPEKLEGKAQTVQVAGAKYAIFIGFMNDKPYEVFVRDGSTKNSEGYIIKAEKGDYYFVSDEDNSKDRVITDKMTVEQALITRLISGNLRHGRHFKYIVEDIDKSGAGIFDFSTAIKKALAKYMKNEDITDKTCPVCGDESVVYEEGCKICKSCGWSACG